MKAISWMTFVFVVGFAMFFRTQESFSSLNRDALQVARIKQQHAERSLSSVEEGQIKQWSELEKALKPQPSIQDFQ